MTASESRLTCLTAGGSRRRTRRQQRFRAIALESLEPRTPLAADITTGLAHHWTFDETSGDVAADSAGGSPGTLANWGARAPKWEPGRIGGVLRFSTADNYVVAQPPARSGSYAVSFWVNAATRDGLNARLFTARSNDIVYINHESHRGVSFASGSTDAFSASPPTFNAWEHYAINFNAATGQGVIYRSGAPVAIGTFSDGPSLTSWVFGHKVSLTDHNDALFGALDDLRVYSRVLSDEDIALLASLGTPEPTHAEPVHHWTFDETTGFTAHDMAGGADGVLLNWNASEPRWEPGKVGGALRFSTADNAVVTSAVSTRAHWSLAFWLNVSQPTGVNPRIYEPWAYYNRESNRGVGFTSRNVSTFDPRPVTLNGWDHYTLTFDTLLDVGTIYRNGVAVNSGFFGDNAPAAALVFGHQLNLDNHDDSLNGLLDDLRIYDRVLTKDEIAALAGVVIATGDNYATNEDTPLIVAAASGLLANDGGALTTTLIAGPTHGLLTLNGNGGFSYTPAPDYNGSDSFTYRAINGTLQSPPATVILNVRTVNDPPTFINGPDQSGTDEMLPTMSTSVVSFSGLNGTPDATFSSYVENGFLVRAISGRWLQAHDPSHITGNPAPAIFGDTYTANLEVTRSAGGTFSFTSFDLSSWEFDFPAIDPVRYTVVGQLAGQTIFTSTGEVATSNFVTVAPPSLATIDTLRFSMVRLNSQAYILDNLRFNIADPAQAIPVWATNLTKAPLTAFDEAAQRLSFSVTTDQPALFAEQPAIDATGRLTYAPAPNVRGTAIVTVVLTDNGGSANGGSDASAPQTFTITIDKPHPWHNTSVLATPQVGALDVDGSGTIGPFDAILIINHLNSGLPSAVPPNAPIGGPEGMGPGKTRFLDTGGGPDDRGDNAIGPFDAILVINWLNARPAATTPSMPSGGAGEGEAEISLAAPTASSANISPHLADLITLLALDTAALPKRRRF